jgi:hypothetical protein
MGIPELNHGPQERSMQMRRSLAAVLAGLVLFAGACGEDDVDRGVDKATDKASEAAKDAEKAGKEAKEDAEKEIRKY